MPGRLGSERLPNKLILPIGDTCLWDIACKKLDQVACEEKCVLVSKDDTELVDIASKYDTIRVIFRTKGTELVDNPLNYVFRDVAKMTSDKIMFLNPCLPFLKKETIQEAANENYTYCESVKPFTGWIYDSLGDLVTPVDFKEMNTKTTPVLYQPAHAFRIFEKYLFLSGGDMSSTLSSMEVITEEEAIDVDTKDDFEFAKWKWENVNS